MGGDGRIRLAKHPNMCINVKGGLVSRGSELVLWPCGGAIPGGGSKDPGGALRGRGADLLGGRGGEPLRRDSMRHPSRVCPTELWFGD